MYLRSCKRQLLPLWCLFIADPPTNPHETTELPKDRFLWNIVFWLKSVLKVKHLLKLEKLWYLTCRPAYIYDHFDITGVAFINTCYSGYQSYKCCGFPCYHDYQDYQYRLVGMVTWMHQKCVTLWTFPILCTNKIWIVVWDIANNFLVYGFIVLCICLCRLMSSCNKRQYSSQVNCMLCKIYIFNHLLAL